MFFLRALRTDSNRIRHYDAFRLADGIEVAWAPIQIRIHIAEQLTSGLYVVLRTVLLLAPRLRTQMEPGRWTAGWTVTILLRHRHDLPGAGLPDPQARPLGLPIA